MSTSSTFNDKGAPPSRVELSPALNDLFALLRRERADVFRAAWNSYKHDRTDKDEVNYPSRHGYTLLHEAVNCKRADIVEFLLAQPEVNVDIFDVFSGRTPLMMAAAMGDVAVINHLLRRSININARSKNGATALMMATVLGKPAAMTALLKHGADATIPDSEGKTPMAHAAHYSLEAAYVLVEQGIDATPSQRANILVKAARGGHVDIVDFLLMRRDFTLDLEDVLGDTPLIAAAMAGQRAMVKYLLNQTRKFAQFEEWTNKQGRTAVMEAARAKEYAIVKMLCDYGVDTARADNKGYTALMHAAEQGDVSSVRYLMKHMAQEQRDVIGIHRVKEQAAAFGVAYKSRHFDVLSAMLEEGYDLSASVLNDKQFQQLSLVSVAVDNRDERLLESALKRGADPNQPDMQGMLPLVSAARSGRFDLVARLLKQRDIKVNERDAIGDTALTGAISWRNESVIKRLLSCGADPNAGDKNGKTPLMLAAEGGLGLDIIKLLLKANAQINAVSKNGRTALDCALCQYDEKPALFLIDKGADVSHVDAGGRSVLMNAIYADRKGVVSRLLEKGVDIHVADRQGCTALYYAVLKGNEPLCRALLNRGAAVNVIDNQGNTPLMCAIDVGNRTIAELLLAAGADPNCKNAVGARTAYDVLNDNESWTADVKESVRALLHTAAEKYTRHRATVSEGDEAIAIWLGRQEVVSGTLLEIVRNGDVGQLRDWYDRKFWQASAEKPDWVTIKTAVLMKNRPVLRLLGNWGGAISAADLEDLRVTTLDRFDASVSLLRNSGFSLPGATPLRSAPPKPKM